MATEIIEPDAAALIHADNERIRQAGWLAESQMGPRPDHDGFPHAFEVFLFKRYDKDYVKIAQAILRRRN